jgi:flavin-dependent dehydrogenase
MRVGGRTDVDVLVAGGGPVGLAAAVAARTAGLTVAVVEPRAGVLDKACGEGLMPSAVAGLRRLGVDVAGREFVGIRYVRSSRSVAARFRHGSGLGVRRTVLHAALADRAAAVGAVPVADRVSDVVQRAGHVEAAGISAGWLIAADGLHSSVRRAVGLHRPPPPGVARYGLRRHFSVPAWSEHVEVHWAATHEAYVTPVADDLVGVAVLGPRGTGFEEALAALPQLRHRLGGAPPAGPVLGAGPLRQRAVTVRRGRVLLVGDAAGYVDALTGEGLATGLASAQAAVDAVAADRPQAYPAAWARLTWRHRVLTRGLLAVATRPGPRAALVPLAATAPPGFACAVNLLA